MNREGDHWGNKKKYSYWKNGVLYPGKTAANFIETDQFYVKVVQKLNTMTLAQLKAADPHVQLTTDARLG